MNINRRRIFQTVPPYFQVPSCGILVTGAGHGSPHGNSRGDYGDLGAVGGAGCAGCCHLHYGPFHIQQP